MKKSFFIFVIITNFFALKSFAADLIVFSYDRPMQLYAFCESAKKYIKGLNSVSIICRSSKKEFNVAYQEVKQAFPDYHFLEQEVKKNSNNFKELTLKAINSAQTYIIFAVDDIIIKDFVDLSDAYYYLEKTEAYGFYLALGLHLTDSLNYKPNDYKQSNHYNYNQPVPAHKLIDKDVYSWNFEDGKYEWNYPNSLDMVLYKKSDIYELICSLNFNSPNSFENLWTEYYPTNKLGLFYRISKVVNIPINRVQNEDDNNHLNLFGSDELLEMFNNGLKIDIEPLFKVLNNDIHWDYKPTFIKR